MCYIHLKLYNYIVQCTYSCKWSGFVFKRNHNELNKRFKFEKKKQNVCIENKVSKSYFKYAK